MACIVNNKIKHHELDTARVSLDHYIKHRIDFPADKNKFLEFSTKPDTIRRNLHRPDPARPDPIVDISGRT